jgi:hypothetical protein
MDTMNFIYIYHLSFVKEGLTPYLIYGGLSPFFRIRVICIVLVMLVAGGQFR